MRIAYLLGFIICAGLLGFAYYAQHVMFLDPCPLCILQRIAFFGMALFFLIGGIHNPQAWGRYVYPGLVSVFGIFGAAIAGRHIWLQSLPADQVPDCGPGLGYMLETLPLQSVLEKVLTGSGECAEVSWSFLGLSMPWWTLIWYVALTLGALVFARRASQRRIFLDG